MEKMNTGKLSANLELKEIKMSRQTLFTLIKSEVFRFYSFKLEGFESDIHSNQVKEDHLNLMEKISDGAYDNMINKLIPNESFFDDPYNVTIEIIDYLEGCGNLEIKVNFNFSLYRESKASESGIFDEKDG